MAYKEEFELEKYNKMFKNMTKHMRKKDPRKDILILKTAGEPIAAGTNHQRSGINGNWRNRSGDIPERNIQESCKTTRQYKGNNLKLYFHTVCLKRNFFYFKYLKYF